MHTILTRWDAMRIAWTLFWFATGTSRVELKIDQAGAITMSGKDLIKE